jgi:hypothetical protein
MIVVRLPNAERQSDKLRRDPSRRPGGQAGANDLLATTIRLSITTGHGGFDVVIRVL